MYTMPMSTTTMFMTTMSMSGRGCLAERGKKKMELKKKECHNVNGRTTNKGR